LTFDDPDVKPVSSDREILERVHRRGRTLRRRKRVARVLSLVTVAVIISASSLAVAHQFGGTKSAKGSFVSDAVTPDDSLTRPMPDVTDSPTPVDSPSDVPSPSVSPTPTLVCLNSYDSACGDFYWDPPPGSNEPLTVTVTVSPSSAQVGDLVTVHVTATDPDAEIRCRAFYWGDEPYELGWASTWLSPHGRWETPAKVLGELSEAYTHSYAKPGTFRISFSAGSGACRANPPNPYTSENGKVVPITITEAPSPSPSVSPSDSPSPSESPSPSPSAT